MNCGDRKSEPSFRTVFQSPGRFFFFRVLALQKHARERLIDAATGLLSRIQKHWRAPMVLKNCVSKLALIFAEYSTSIIGAPCMWQHQAT